VNEPETRLVFVLLGLAIASVPTSYWPGGSVSTITDLFGKSVIIFLLLANVLTTAHRVKAMVWLLALCSALPAIAVIRNYRSGNLMQLEARVEGYGGSLASNPNDVALTLNMIIPLAIGLLLCARSLVQRVVLGLVITLAVGGVIVTLSRAGFIFLVITVVLYLTQVKKLRILIIPVILLLLLYMNGVDGFFNRMETIGDVTTPGSAHDRWDNIKKAWAIMIAHPVFGVGIGQNILALNDMGTYWGRVHNVYLEVGAELGISGLVVYLLLLRHCLRSIWRATKIWRSLKLNLYYLAQGLSISLIGFAVAVNFYPVAYHFYFYYLAGLAVAMKVLARKHLHLLAVRS